MKITSLETIQLREFPNLVWLHIYTDEGLIGLGETFFGASAVAACVQETAAPYLIGRDPRSIRTRCPASMSAPGPQRSCWII